MTAKQLLLPALSLAFAAGCGIGAWVTRTAEVNAASKMVYELRTYTTNEGKLDALNARFRNHTMKIFKQHGMKNVGYWVPQDEPAHSNTLVYIIAHKDRETAKENWKAFSADPVWQKAKEESERDGKLVTKVESVFLDATDYSPIQ